MSEMIKAAREAYNGANEVKVDRDAAIEAIYQALLANRSFKEDIYRKAAYDLWRQFNQEIRSDIQSAKTGFVPRFSEHQHESMSERMDRLVWHNWRLPVSGKPLGDATREDLVANIRHYHGLSNAMAVSSEWLQAILARVGEGRTVRECVSENICNVLRQAAADKVKDRYRQSAG